MCDSSGTIVYNITCQFVRVVGLVGLAQPSFNLMPYFGSASKVGKAMLIAIYGGTRRDNKKDDL